MEIKYIIQDLNDKHYPYNSEGFSFTWSYDQIVLYDDEESANRGLRRIKSTAPNNKRNLIVITNEKLLRKIKLEEIAKLEN